MASQLTLTRRQTGWTVLAVVVAMAWFALPASLRHRIVPVAYAANFTVTNANDDGPGSLRQAIVTSNLNMGPSANLITFNIPGSGVKTISPLSPLPAITAAVTIDGLSQPGTTVGGLLIELDGSQAGANANGLNITAGHCTISSLVINRFNGAGLLLQDGGENLIVGNRIGTDTAGHLDRGNTVAGIRVVNSNGNTIQKNLISGNDGPGVSLIRARLNVFTGNTIGTNVTTTVALGNLNGIFIDQESLDNTIGPAVNVSSDINVIAGNSSDGIDIRGNNNLVRSNYIGHNGASAIPNGNDGIFILSGAANTIGGTSYSTTNVISGNLGNGIEIRSTAAIGNQVIGNFIGTNAAPSAGPLPNGANGILIDTAASNTTIGGTNTFSSLPQNFIAYNKGDGIRVNRGFDNKVIGNYIHDNLGAGVFVGDPGVILDGGTLISGNRIFNDGTLGIDLAPAGVTPNDPGDVDGGANGLQNFPVLSSAAASQGHAFIRGTLNSKANSTYRLEFFVSNACDASGSGEAEGFIGFTSVATDGNGNASFEFSSGNGTDAARSGQVVSATATDSISDTSELSPCLGVQDAGNFSFASFSTTVSETAGSVTLTVGRSGNRGGAASVDYATTNGTATPGADYTAVSGTLNFADGEAQKTITIPINNDSLSEGVELFHVDLSNPNGGPGLALATTDVIIDDDEQPSGNVYVLTTNNELLRFNTARGGPTPLSAVQIIGEKILAVDFRPATGQLYGLGLSGHLYTIDKNTGTLTQVGTSVISGLPEFTGFGFDFNPVTDRLRVALYDDRNLQLNPGTGTISVDGTLAFASGDANAGVNPVVYGLANSNNFTGATATTTYAINWTDAFFPTKLVTLGSTSGSPTSPNTGQLFTVGSTGAATADFAGFDISDAGEAFASLAHPESINLASLFKIDLTTGVATRIGSIGSTNRTARDIAIEPLQRVQFSSALYSVNENDGAATITVKRNGGGSGALSVNYASSDGNATAGQDYTTTSGTLTFAAGETSKTVTVPLFDDSVIEGVETINLSLSNATNGAVIGPQSAAKIAVMDEPTEAGTNPIDNGDFFVRQHYSDFLNRTPDSGGLAFWTNHITECFNDPACIDDRRIGTSAAFFIENEFQQTGFFIYRFYQAALGRRPTYTEFTTDRGQVIGGANLENGKQAFAIEFVQRQAFLDKYPLSMDGPGFVDALIATASQASGIVDLATRRDSLIAQYNLGANQTDSRVRVARALIDDSAFSASLYNPAFVLMQYFGYLRRPPDQAGYNFWLDHLNNRNANNYRAMVCAFITSHEYQRRFGQIISRSNQDCPP
jgi:parallel beta-helix repeat protein